MSDVEDLQAQLEAAMHARNAMGAELERCRQRAEAAEHAQQEAEAELARMSSTQVMHRVAAEDAGARAARLAVALRASVGASAALRQALAEMVAGTSGDLAATVSGAIAAAAELGPVLDDAGLSEVWDDASGASRPDLAAKAARLVADLDLARRALTAGDAAAAAQLARTAVAAIVCARPYAVLMPDEAAATGDDAERELRILRRAHEDVLVCLGQAVS